MVFFPNFTPFQTYLPVTCMKSMLRLLALLLLASGPLVAQLPATFADQSPQLGPTPNFSGVAMAVCDFNGDGRDDIARLNNGQVLSFAFQTTPGQPFALLNHGDLPGGIEWGMCAADIDQNGMADILAGGAYNGIKILRANADASAWATETIGTPGTFVQCVNFADINMDGWLDAFVCHDDGPPRIFGNDGAGGMVYQPNWMNFFTVPTSDNSGNYGSVFSDVDGDNDLDLYIAKCRQGVNSPNDGRRINQLFLNNGDGTYTQDTADVAGLRIGAQSWTADFGDIDNDGDFDCFITNHDVPSQLLINDGSGHFTDISVASNVASLVGGLPIQGVFRDLDNDGWLDIVVAGSQHYYLLNNHDQTFTTVAGFLDERLMESYGIGDLNHDGFWDIYAGYAQPFNGPTSTADALWMNDGNNNHYLACYLRGTTSNLDAVGAKLTLYTSAGIQVREVRSGESYGIMNSMNQIFGLGAVEAIDSLVVRWPSGARDVFTGLAIDQYHTIQEGGCVVPNIVVAADGATVFCTGDSLAISAPDGYNYAWSNGDSSQTIQVTEAGAYTVTVTTAVGCTAISNEVSVTVDPVEIPAIAVTGDTVFCAGGTVVLTATPAASYQWSNGATTQSIDVNAGGLYTVTTQGLCDLFTSAPQSVTLIEANAPVATGDTIFEVETAQLFAEGDSLLWYATASSNMPLGSGNNFTTGILTEDTQFWVEQVVVIDQPNAFTGMTGHQGSNFSGNTFNGTIIFDAQVPFRLKSVKVYTDKAGIRKIDLRDAQNNAIQSVAVDIPVGTSVINVDLDVPVGADLILTTDETINQINLGYASPRLRRSDAGVTYPYEIADVVSITGSNGGADRYYSFFDWEIDFYGIACTSPRSPVAVQVDSIVGIGEPLSAGKLELWPSPTTGVYHLELKNVPHGTCDLMVFNAQGEQVNRQTIQAQGQVFTGQLVKLPAGLYTVQLRGEKGLWVEKVVLIK